MAVCFSKIDCFNAFFPDVMSCKKFKNKNFKKPLRRVRPKDAKNVKTISFFKNITQVDLLKIFKYKRSFVFKFSPIFSG